MNTDYILDASAFINGFILDTNYNYTTAEVVSEIRDFKSKLVLDIAINDGKLSIVQPGDEFLGEVQSVISESGDVLRLSQQDISIIALALDFYSHGRSVMVISDDYTIQNTLKILDIPFSSILTFGIDEVYNWVKVCSGCKRQYSEDYPFDDCEVCGSSLYKKRCF